MKLTVNDKEAEKIRAVMLDGKRVELAVGLDTDEGWVDVMLPHTVSEELVKAGQSINIEDTKNPEFNWERRRLYGKVEVIWHEESASSPG